MQTSQYPRRLQVTFSTLNMSIVWAAGSLAQPAESEWIYAGSDGKLVYKTTSSGDRIMDFSHAGYMGGGVALPKGGGQANGPAAVKNIGY
jgi:hypothetical protein